MIYLSVLRHHGHAAQIYAPGRMCTTDLWILAL